MPIDISLKRPLAEVGAVVILILLLSAIWMFRYRGISKSETVEIIQSTASGGGTIAMLVRRSDRSALSGDTYFVLVHDRLYSLDELRKRLRFVAGFRCGPQRYKHSLGDPDESPR